MRVVEERGQRTVQGVRVVQRSTADARTGHHEHVAQQVHALHPEQSERGCPDVVLEAPARLGQLAVGETPTGLDDRDAVTLLGESQGRNRSAETGADDDGVVVVRGGTHGATVLSVSDSVVSDAACDPVVTA